MEEVEGVKNSGVKAVNTIVRNSGVKPVNTITHWEPEPHSLLDYPILDVKATPLFQLSSIKISWPAVGRKTRRVRIFGTILLIDDLGNEFSLFHRQPNKPLSSPVEIKSKWCTTTIQNFQLEGLRCLPNAFCLVFYLKERNTNSVLMDEIKFIDCSDFAYDKVCRIHFGGHYLGHSRLNVVVEYIIFQCANLACVSLIVERSHGNSVERCRNRRNSDTVATMEGTMFATYEMSNKSAVKHVVLGDRFIFPRFGDLIELSTFGVPAYSLLEIKTSIRVNGELFVTHENLVFDPRELHGIPFERKIMGKNFCLRVLVSWRHATWLPESKIYEWCDQWYMMEEEDKETLAERLINKCEQRRGFMIENKFEPNGIPPSLQVLNYRRWFAPGLPRPLVEVFSISVCLYGLNDSATLGLCGTILCDDGTEKFVTFNESKIKPQLIRPFERVPLKCLGRCYGEYFGVELDLKDNKGHEISNGYLGYDLATVKNWLNRRVCSIVRGRDGFAAVYHTVFSDAVQSKLQFTVIPDFGAAFCCQVYGRISASYGNFRYTKPYEKKFYQSVLFEKHENEAVKMLDGEIPLSKSVVAVPLIGSLIVMADINVLMDDECETLKYSFEAKVNIEKLEMSKLSSNKIQGSKSTLRMSVGME